MRRRILLVFILVFLSFCIPAYSYAEGDTGTGSISCNQKITYMVDPDETQRFTFTPQENGVYKMTVSFEQNDFISGSASFMHNGVNVPFNFTSYEDSAEYFSSYNDDFYGIKGETYVLEFIYSYVSEDKSPARQYTIELTESDKCRNRLAFDKKQTVSLSQESTYYSFIADTSGYYQVITDNVVQAFFSVWSTDGTHNTNPPYQGMATGAIGETRTVDVVYLNAGDICVTELRKYDTNINSVHLYLRKVPKITEAAGSCDGNQAEMNCKLTWFTPERNGEYYFTDNVLGDFNVLGQAFCIKIKRNDNSYSNKMEKFKEEVPVTQIAPGTDDMPIGSREYYFTGEAGCDYLLVSTYYAENAAGTVTVTEESPANLDRRRNIKYSEPMFGEIRTVEYNGKKQTPYVQLLLAQKLLTQNNQFTVKFSNNVKVGKAKVTVKGKSPYYGTKSFTFKIIPKQVPLKKLKAGKKSFTVTWKKQTSQTTGYQIQYCTDPLFEKKVKTVTIKNNKTTKKTIKKLKSKKKYYVRIRTYKKVGKKKYYSYWSELWGDIKHRENVNGLKPYCIKTK